MNAFDPTGVATFINGEFCDGSTAKLSIFDRGLLYGDGVFDSMPVVSRALFRPADYFGRLLRSARAMHLTVTLDYDDFLEISGELVRRSGVSDGNLRIIITRGNGVRLTRDSTTRCDAPSIVAILHPTPPMIGARVEPPQPISLLTSSVVRKAPRSVGSHVKSLNYIDSILAQQQAWAAGMDDAIMVDFVGAIAECTTSNLFSVCGKRLITPTTRAALPGITRQTVLELASELAIDAAERDIWPHELYVSDALFQTGSGSGIVPVGNVDGHLVASQSNPTFTAISEAYTLRTRDLRFTHAVTL